jgi:hypothetical protein
MTKTNTLRLPGFSFGLCLRRGLGSRGAIESEAIVSCEIATKRSKFSHTKQTWQRLLFEVVCLESHLKYKEP